MYIKFNDKTGEITGFGSRPPEDQKYVEVPEKVALDLKKSRQLKKNTIVKYDTLLKKYVLADKHKSEDYIDYTDYSNVMYEVQAKDEENFDVKIVQNFVEKKWQVLFAKEVKENVLQTKSNLEELVTFYITSPGDPNILYKTLSANMYKLVDDTYGFPFTMPFEENKESVSIYTTKKFVNYYYEKVGYEI